MKTLTGHILIDGHNVIHAWPELKRQLDTDRMVALDRLVALVRIIYDFDDKVLTIVFDGNGEKTKVENPEGNPYFSIVYAAKSVTADGVIEHMLQATASSSDWIVVTADMALSQTAYTYGADIMSPDALGDWIGRLETSQRRVIEAQNRANDTEWK